MSSRPRAISCYICGRQYMLGSIDIHVKQCEVLFQKREAKKPKALQKRLPKKPTSYSGRVLSRLGDEALEKLAREVQGTYEKLALVECKWCHRTMTESALARHNVLCTFLKPMRAVKDQVRRGDVTGIKSPPLSNLKRVPLKPTTPFSQASHKRTFSTPSEKNGSEKSPRKISLTPLTRRRSLRSPEMRLSVSSCTEEKASIDGEESLFTSSSRVWVSPTSRVAVPKLSPRGVTPQLCSQPLTLDKRPKTSIINSFQKDGSSRILKQELLSKADCVELNLLRAMDELRGLRLLVNRIS